MVGLGEKKSEILQVMDDMRSADIDFITIGQYLRPTLRHAPVDRYVHPDEFKFYEKMAYNKGFLMVSASPLTRSSYHAGEDFAKMRQERLSSLNIIIKYYNSFEINIYNKLNLSLLWILYLRPLSALLLLKHLLKKQIK